MKMKAPKPRNLVHLALLRNTRNAVHGKTVKRERANQRVAMRRNLKDEGVCVEQLCVAQSF
jgi:hypothetical protein